MFKGSSALKVMRRAIITVIVLLIVVLGVRFIGGYAFTPRSALGSMPIHGKNANVFDDLNFGWAHVYLVKTKSGYETAIVERYGPFWSLKGTAVLEQKSSAPIQTVGWASVDRPDHQLAVFAVETTDPQVKSVVVGPSSNVQKKSVSPGHPVVFSWDSNSLISDYNAIALSGSGKELYYYGYPKNTGGVVNSSELKWHPAS